MTRQASRPRPSKTDHAARMQRKWRTRKGQIWDIHGSAGTHRLMVGDSADAACVRRLVGRARARLMATDPPYGVNFRGGKHNPRATPWAPIAGDDRQGEEMTAWLAAVLRAWLPAMADDACYYLWTAPLKEGASSAAAMVEAGLHIEAQIIWVKNHLVLGRTDYHWIHEGCWYGYRRGKRHRWLSDRKQTTAWHVPRVHNTKYLHPHQKPVELYARPMRHHTRRGEFCFDPFLGSGTGMVAAEQLGRVCRGMEIDPKWAAVVLERMSELGCRPRLRAAKRPAAETAGSGDARGNRKAGRRG